MAVALVAGALTWIAMDSWSPDGRAMTALALASLGAAGLGVYAGGLWAIRALPPRGPVAIGTGPS